jgi:hypothetical protein
VTDLEAAAEYGAAAELWRAFCARSKNTEHLDLYGAPLAVVLLAGLCAPLSVGEGFTGDVLADVLAGAISFVRNLDLDSGRGGGGGNWIDNDEIEALLRRLRVVATLRDSERVYREHLTRKLGDEKRGAP